MKRIKSFKELFEGTIVPAWSDNLKVGDKIKATKDMSFGGGEVFTKDKEYKIIRIDKIVENPEWGEETLWVVKSDDWEALIDAFRIGLFEPVK